MEALGALGVIGSVATMFVFTVVLANCTHGGRKRNAGGTPIKKRSLPSLPHPEEAFIEDGLIESDHESDVEEDDDDFKITEETEEEEQTRTHQQPELYPLATEGQSLDVPPLPVRSPDGSVITFTIGNADTLEEFTIVDDEAEKTQTHGDTLYARVRPKKQRPLSVPPRSEHSHVPALPERRYTTDVRSLAKDLRASTPLREESQDELEELRKMALAARAMDDTEEEETIDMSTLQLILGRPSDDIDSALQVPTVGDDTEYIQVNDYADEQGYISVGGSSTSTTPDSVSPTTPVAAGSVKMLNTSKRSASYNRALYSRPLRKETFV